MGTTNPDLKIRDFPGTTIDSMRVLIASDGDIGIQIENLYGVHATYLSHTTALAVAAYIVQLVNEEHAPLADEDVTPVPNTDAPEAMWDDNADYTNWQDAL